MKRAARSAAEPDEGRMRAYLLGGLSERERTEMDCELLTDDDLFEAVSALEHDLLADYAAGELTAAEAAVVKRWLAASQDVRDRLALIKALAAKGAALRAAAASKPAKRSKRAS
jgi:anti-sigma factor RsiW